MAKIAAFGWNRLDLRSSKTRCIHAVFFSFQSEPEIKKSNACVFYFLS